MSVNHNFFTAVHPQLLKWSDHIFLNMTDSGDKINIAGNQSFIQFCKADHESAQLANKLSELGLKPGDRVTAQVDKSPQVVILYLACLRAGFIFHPLNTAYTLNELDYFLSDAKPSLFVCDRKREDEAKHLIKKHAIKLVLTLESGGYGTGSLFQDIGFSTYSNQFETAIKNMDDTALLIYTSGTTGKPKGAMITHENIASNALSLARVWNWTNKDRLLHVLPLFHVHGLCVGLHLPLIAGSEILFQSKFSVKKTIKLLPHASVMMAVPTIYTRLLSDSKFQKETCNRARVFISGSAPLLPETFEEFEQRTGHRILERYGMTEAQMITSNPLYGERRRGTVGLPLPDVECRICDNNGIPLEQGEIGSLEIKGPNVFKGYWKNAEASEQTFRGDGFFITGDVAKFDKSGVLTIVGREKDLIISAGLNVYPSEVEFQINQIPQVKDSTVFGAPHPDLGEGVVAAVIRNSTDLSESQIEENLKQNLSQFKIPKKIVFVDEFPRNAMGKIEKNRLRESYSSIFTDETGDQ